jgi:hypothetical protein
VRLVSDAPSKAHRNRRHHRHRGRRRAASVAVSPALSHAYSVPVAGNGPVSQPI